MGIVVAPLSIVSIISIIIMIATPILFYYKKWMMVYAIIFANFIVFIISFIFINQVTSQSIVVAELAFKPIYLSAELFPQLYTLFTATFLHSTVNVLHIIFNVFMFILIAPSFEDKIGPKKFLAIYLITGVCAALAHALVTPLLSEYFSFNPNVGLIGASGAISGILGAYAYAYPRDKVLFPIIFIVRIPVLYAGLFFLAVQTFFVFGGGEENVAYMAHIGGFLSGVVLAAILIRRKSDWDQPIKQRSYDYYSQKKEKKIDMGELRKIATTPELKEILVKIENETIPQARDMWLEHFLEKAKCPVCGNELSHSGRNINCKNCGFNTKY